MNVFIRLVTGLSRLSGVVAAGLIAAAVLVVCQMVFVRYILGQSTAWQTEFVTYALIAATFVGSPYVLLTRGHVNVDLLPLYLGGSARFALALFAAGISCLFCLVLAWRGAVLWYEAYDLGWRSDTIWSVRLWIPYSAMPIGIGLLSLQYIVDIANLILGREPPFGIHPEDRL
ncbi:TRAP transporter small permease [Rhodospirillaceae bacterium SYSU D60014]|jgi:TRAP-type C4-dicarboxylate transport system permease small subunit|uniref:TRAP transporter small permease n=1 Tax=Virgifigura deserti TaxID=2268457 RepID=UPI000E669533